MPLSVPVRPCLLKKCGLPFGPSTSNIDIVYVADGYHNGPCRGNLNTELDCFHRRLNINTYAIAIGNAALESMQAMENPRNSSDSHIFNVNNFQELGMLFNQISKLLSIKDSDGNLVYNCALHNQPWWVRECRANLEYIYTQSMQLHAST